MGSLKTIRAIEFWPKYLAYPLTYPDPDGEFFGYNLNGIMLNDYPLDNFLPGTRILIHHLLLGDELLAGMRVAHQIISRQQTITNYEATVGDEWASVIREAVERCRNIWFYEAPQIGEDRSYLRQLCWKALDFENRIVSRCQLKCRSFFSVIARSIYCPQYGQAAKVFLSIWRCIHYLRLSLMMNGVAYVK